MILRRVNGIFLVIVFLSIFVLGGIQVSAVDKIPNFGTIKESDMRDSYFVYYSNGKAKKVKMPEMETIMITRFFNMNEYTEVYIKCQFTEKISNPYIEVRVSPHRIMNLYCSGGGFVYLDKKKQFFVKQDKFSTFFHYCNGKYLLKKDNIKVQNGKYKPLQYNMKNFLDDIKKYGCPYKVLKSNKGEFCYSEKVSTIEAYEEKFNVFYYYDNVAMEFGAMCMEVAYEAGNWAKKPHYFKRGNIIVHYAGDNVKLIECIEKAMGKQYIGFKNF